MKLAFSTLGCPEWNFREIMSTAKDLGYQGVEIRGIKNTIYTPDIHEFSKRNLSQTKDIIAGYGLEIPCLTSAAYLSRKDLRAEAQRETRDYIDLAQKLATPYVRLLGDTVIEPGANVDDGFVRDNLFEAAEYAQNTGVTPLIETNGVYSDTKRLSKVVDGISGIGVLWDIHHPARFFEETPEQTYDNIGAYLKHVHIKDSKLDDKQVHYMPLGHGSIPVAQALCLLNLKGYTGYYSLEWVRRWDKSLESAGLAFAQYINYMKRHI